jgi:membrane protein DedA with SNARE-associated domain
MPFKIFVATAGALEYSRWRFLATVMVARSVRYYVEGTLAVFYGPRVLRFIADNGLAMLSIVVAVSLIGLLVYVLTKRGKRVPSQTGQIESEEA